MPLRAFGGVTRAELLKEQWVPATFGSNGGTMQAFGNQYPGVLLDAAAEYAHIMMKAPPNFTSLGLLNIVVIGLTAGLNNYNVGIDVHVAAAGELSSTHVLGLNTDVLINQFFLANIPLTVLMMGSINPGDFIAVRVAGQAAGGGKVATNLHVLGAYVTWN